MTKEKEEKISAKEAEITAAEIKAKEATEAAQAREDVIKRTNDAAKRIEEANEKAETLANEKATAEIEGTLGGKAKAGGEPKEETPEEYTKKVMANDVEGTKDT